MVCFNGFSSISCKAAPDLPGGNGTNLAMKGTFGPMASAFSVCALVENWRVLIPPGSDEARGISEKDPKWYVRTLQLSKPSRFMPFSVAAVPKLSSPDVGHSSDQR